MVDETFIRISNRDIFQKLSSIEDKAQQTAVTIGRIEEHLATLNSRVAKTEFKTDKNEQTLAKLTAKVAGVAGTVALIVTAVFKVV